MQGFIITAYRSPDYLSELINEITTHGDLVWLHIDRKSTFSGDDLDLQRRDLVQIFQQYSINWGSVGHLSAILMLMEHAVQHTDISHFHIISGQDSIVRYPDPGSIGNRILLTAREVNAEDPIAMRRLEQFNCFPNADTQRMSVRAVNKVMWKAQQWTGHRRSRIPGFEKAYKGVIWSSMPYDALRYVVGYHKAHPAFMRFLRHTIIPEEFFLQTILMNSPMSAQITGFNARYTDWVLRNGSYPAYIDESDLNAIKQSNSIFARKIDPQISKRLLELLKSDSSHSLS